MASAVRPTASGAERVQLRFWQWYSYGNGQGEVQVSVGKNGAWVTLARPERLNVSPPAGSDIE